jgi:hypothetical protein
MVPKPKPKSQSKSASQPTQLQASKQRQRHVVDTTRSEDELTNAPLVSQSISSKANVVLQARTAAQSEGVPKQPEMSQLSAKRASLMKPSSSRKTKANTAQKEPKGDKDVYDIPLDEEKGKKKLPRRSIATVVSYNKGESDNEDAESDYAKTGSARTKG